MQFDNTQRDAKATSLLTAWLLLRLGLLAESVVPITVCGSNYSSNLRSVTSTENSTPGCVLCYPTSREVVHTVDTLVMAVQSEGWRWL